MSLRRSQRRAHDRLIGLGFGRAAGGRPVFDDLGVDPVHGLRLGEQPRELRAHVVLALARDHAAVEQQLAGFRHDIVGMAAMACG